MEQKKHIGKKTRVKFIGGDYHGEEKQLRAPIKNETNVAQAPKYKGNNFYEPSELGYQTYYLRFDPITEEPVYVWSEWIEDYDKRPSAVIEREYESENNKAIRLEREEQERMRRLMEKDFKRHGFAVMVHGKRVAPGDVKFFVNTKHPDYEKLFSKKLPKAKND